MAKRLLPPTASHPTKPIAYCIGTGHPVEVDERPKPPVGLDPPGVFDVTTSLRKVVDPEKW
jgi:hypothetical protein